MRKNNNVKYKDIRIGKFIFTVKLTAVRDCDFGDIVRYEVYDWHIPAPTAFKRFFQWWKLEYYGGGSWCPLDCKDTLEERLVWKCDQVVKEFYAHKDFQEQWENI